ncbi:zona pellucida sperm-binding protein 1 [Indicator indicator]|uniref:zona pellucida sperm-binding protein 1 n=1 Tax=Indicator indicator TaxID=1002788 RepID=UPI0023DFAF85|nr:zona pellucida sperm-binding protein 1 [Indicator indicator]
MGRGCSLLLLLLLLSQWPGAAFSLLRSRYDCGDYGMQLQAYPSRGRTVRFKVMDEFGTRFDVANCSICLHWLSTGGDGAVIFSSGYDGCHVLVKDDRYVLRVQLEELLLSGVMAAFYEVNMTCPKPGDYEVLRDGSQAGQGNGIHQTQTDVLVPLSQPGLLHHVSQSSLTISRPQLSAQGHSEQVHSIAQTQPVLVRPGLQPQPRPSLVHPGLPAQPGQAHLGLQTQNQQGLTRPGRQPPVQPGQTQPGLLRPGLQSQTQPGLVHPGAQTQPGLHTPNRPGLVHPGAQSQPSLHTLNRPVLLNSGAQSQPGRQTPNRPGLVQPGAQTQPGLHTSNRPGLLNSGAQPQPGLYTPNRPGLVQPGAQTQPGLHTSNRPGLVQPGAQTQPGLHTSNRPGLVQPGAQTQPGLYTPNRPGLLNSGAQPQPGLHNPNRPGLVHPGAQTQPSLLQPGFQTQNHLGLLHHSVQSGSTHAGAQTQAGFIHSGAQPPNQPGFSRPSLQTHSQAGLLHPGLQNQAGLVHVSSSQGDTASPALQSRPGMVRPGLQAQLHSGLEHPRLQPQTSLLQSTALFYPSAGAGTQLTREQCQVAAGKMPCMAPEGREACVQAGCCYNDMDRVTPCYYGNTATVQCLLDGHFVVVVPRGLGTQPYNLDSVRLASSQPGCEPLRLSEAFVMFRFAVTQCGTTVQVIEDHLIYENQLISTVDVQGSPRGSITRDSIYILQARCIYNATDLLPLHMEVAVPPTSIPLAMLGPLGLQLRIATDETYSSYHPSGDYPLVKVLRDPIYVEVRLLQKTDPNLVLVLHHCWAAPSTNAAAEPQWPILVDGCPFTGDNYRTQLIPVGPASPQVPFPSHYQRFAISTFTFVEPPSMAALEGEVYISCSASVCHLAQPEPCRPSCQLGVPSRARRSAEDKGTAEATGMVTSQGGVIFPKVPKLHRG